MAATQTGNKRMNYLRLQVLMVDGGTLVLRHIVDDIIPPGSLRQHQNVIQQLVRTNKLYVDPFSQTAAGSTRELDITALSCLLRHICGLKRSHDPVWKTPPSTSDTSLEADIVRLRNLRNQFAHINSTSGVADGDFQHMWSEIMQVLLRINTHAQLPIQNLQTRLDDYMTCPIDEDAEESKQQIINQWIASDETVENEISRLRQELGSNISVVASNVDTGNERIGDVHAEIIDLREALEYLKIKETPDQQNVDDYSQQFFEEKERNRIFYVMTPTHNEASKQLQQCGIVILSGHQGEGKTTMASYLLLETTPRSKILKVSRPEDWSSRSSSKYTAALIDDIFGHTIFEEELLRQWNSLLPQVESAAKSRRMLIVITMRRYILEDSRDKTQCPKLFRLENVVEVSSRKLTEKHMIDILQKHLQKNKKDMDADLLRRSVDNICRRKEDKKPSIGFPECAAMFASEEFLFMRGPAFFKAPVAFFEQCLDELFNEEDEFVAFMLVWTKPDGKLMTTMDLEKKTLSKHLAELFQHVDYPFEPGKRKKLVKCVTHHSEGLINFNKLTGEYSFTHSVIEDVVGLCAAKKSPAVVIKYGSKTFLMKYATVNEDDMSPPGYGFSVPRFRFKQFCKKLFKLLYSRQMGRSKNIKDTRLKEKGLQNTKLSEQNPDLSVLLHSAFSRSDFIEVFIEYLKEKDALDIPVLEAFEHFKRPYSVTFEAGGKGMGIPSYLAAKGKSQFLLKCLDAGILSGNEKEMSLLIAVETEDESLISTLLEKETNVTEEAIQIACFKDESMLRKLLSYVKGKLNNFQNIENNSSPLITAAKQGLYNVIIDLLEVFDINYRNANKLSALDIAVQRNHVEVCKTLLENGHTVNEKGGKFERTPLHTASDMGHLEIAKVLLTNGAKVDVQDHRNEFPVHSAALQRRYDLVRLLLRFDRSLANKPLGKHGRSDLGSMTLYHYAIKVDDYYLLSILEEFNIDPNVTDRYGRTPLYFAAEHNKYEFVKRLLRYADAEKPENRGFTPLHVATHKRYRRIVEVLKKCERLEVVRK